MSETDRKVVIWGEIVNDLLFLANKRPSRIDYMTADEAKEAVKVLSEIVARFDALMMGTVSGRLPAATIDKFLEVSRRLQALESDMMDYEFDRAVGKTAAVP